MKPVLLLAIAYLLGAVPFGYLLVRWRSGRDVRMIGSGNIGATNAARAAGRMVGVLTLLLDIAKGFIAVWLMARVAPASPAWQSAAALAVMAGHAFTPFLRFRGGKAMASFVGAFLYLTPFPLIAALVVFLVTVLATRYVSLGSVFAAGSFPFGVWLLLHPPAVVLLAAMAAAAFIIWRHRDNLVRLRQGTEHELSLRP